MSAVVLVVFVFISLLVEIFAQNLVRLIQEVVLAYANPVEFWVAVEELLQQVAGLLVGSQLLGEVAKVLVAPDPWSCGEQTVIVECLGIEHGYAEGVAATHGQSARPSRFFMVR